MQVWPWLVPVLLGLLEATLAQAHTAAVSDRPSEPRRLYATLLETQTHTYVTVVTRTLAEPLPPSASPTSPPASLLSWRDSGWVWLPKNITWLLYWLCTLVWAGCYGVGYWAMATLVWTPLVWATDLLLSYGPLLAFGTCTALAGIVLGGMVAWFSARIAPVRPPPARPIPPPHADKDTSSDAASTIGAHSVASSATVAVPPTAPSRVARSARVPSPPQIAKDPLTAVPLAGLKRRIITKHYHSARNHSFTSDLK